MCGRAGAGGAESRGAWHLAIEWCLEDNISLCHVSNSGLITHLHLCLFCPLCSCHETCSAVIAGWRLLPVIRQQQLTCLERQGKALIPPATVLWHLQCTAWSTSLSPMHGRSQPYRTCMPAAGFLSRQSWGSWAARAARDAKESASLGACLSTHGRIVMAVSEAPAGCSSAINVGSMLMLCVIWKQGFTFCLICKRSWLRVLCHTESQRFTHTTQGSTMKLKEPQPQSVMQAHNSQQFYTVVSAVLPEVHWCLIGSVRYSTERQP